MSKVPTTKLPKDGAAYTCSFSVGVIECTIETTKGIKDLDTRDKYLAKAPHNVSFMRALCDEHLDVVSSYVKE